MPGFVGHSRTIGADVENTGWVTGADASATGDCPHQEAEIAPDWKAMMDPVRRMAEATASGSLISKREK